MKTRTTLGYVSSSTGEKWVRLDVEDRNGVPLFRTRLSAEDFMRLLSGTTLETESEIEPRFFEGKVGRRMFVEKREFHMRAGDVHKDGAVPGWLLNECAAVIRKELPGFRHDAPHLNNRAKWVVHFRKYVDTEET